MKRSALLSAAAFTLGLLSLGASPSFAQDATAAFTPAFKKPVPIKVVHPAHLPSRFKDSTVRIALTVDEHGTPSEVKPVGAMPEDLAKHLLPVIEQWRFSPMYQNGKPVPAQVILPIALVEES